MRSPQFIGAQKQIYVWHVAHINELINWKFFPYPNILAKQKKRQKGLQEPGQSKARQSIA